VVIVRANLALGRLGHAGVDAVDLALHFHLDLDHRLDRVVRDRVEVLVEVLRLFVALPEPGERRVDVGGRNGLTVLLRFLAQQDPLDHVLLRPVFELNLPLGGVPVGKGLLVARPQPLDFLLDFLLFNSFAVDDKGHHVLLLLTACDFVSPVRHNGRDCFVAALLAMT
jgi:hypothetical protein